MFLELIFPPIIIVGLVNKNARTLCYDMANSIASELIA